MSKKDLFFKKFCYQWHMPTPQKKQIYMQTQITDWHERQRHWLPCYRNKMKVMVRIITFVNLYQIQITFF